MLIPIGILAASGAGGGAGAFDLLETTVLTSSASSVTFSGLGAYSDYKHLQIRMLIKSTSTSYDRLKVNLNNDTSGSYVSHYLRGNGAGVTSGNSGASQIAMYEIAHFTGTLSSDTVQFTPVIFDLLDFASSNKNSTVRALSGYKPSTGTSYVNLTSGAYINTAAVTTIGLSCQGLNFQTGSRFSLYGIKG